MIIVEKFFCFNLYSAGIILGWFGFGGSLMNIVTNVMILSNVDYYMKQQSILSDFTPEEVRSQIITSSSIYICLSIMDLVASIFLIAGTVKNKRLLLIPWLIERATSILITAFLLLFYGLFLLFASTKTILLGIFLLFLGFGVVVVMVYCWLSIYSLYSLFREQELEHPPLTSGEQNRNYTAYARII